MPKGASGRIVIEVDPNLKRRLYSALAMDNLTLKDWFLNLAQRYVSQKTDSTAPVKRARAKQTKSA